MNLYNIANQKLFSFCLIAFSLYLNAQTPISFEEAYQKAMENNLTLKNALLKKDFQATLKDSYKGIDPLNISVEYGQINSAYTDNKLSISQNFRFPSVYTKQKNVLLEEWKSSLLNIDFNQWQIKKELALLFNELYYLDKKNALLQQIAQLYSQYFQRSQLRFSKGESNILEKTSAEMLQAQAELQKNAIQKDRAIAEQKLSFIINDGTLYTNKKVPFEVLPILPEEKNREWNTLASVQMAEQQKKIEEAKLASEKSKLLPSLNVGYNTATIRGTGADDQIYSASHRFHSVVVGVAIPIFNAGQQAIIRSQKINTEIAENQYQQAIKNIALEYNSLVNQYRTYEKEIQYFQEKGLKNADIITTTVQKQLNEGEINFLQWTMLINQALEIQNQYIESLKNINKTAIEINALANHF